MADDEASTSSSSTPWSIGTRRIPKGEIVFFTQALIIIVVIVSCIYNLSKPQRTDETLWSTLLASCLGYMLPAPTLSTKKKS